MRKTRAFWKRYNRERYRRSRAAAVEAMGGRCGRCGDELGPFEFHHVNGDGGQAWAALASFARYKMIVQDAGGIVSRGEVELLCEPCHALEDDSVHTTPRRRRHR